MKNWFLLLLGLVAIGLSFPIEGGPGIALALVGAALSFIAARRFGRSGAR
jgi:uncharacterized protein (TIGR03382 family)